MILSAYKAIAIAVKKPSSVTPCLRGGCCVLLAGALLAGLGCTVGPGYKRPTAQVPDTWKGEGPANGSSEGCDSQGRVVADISRRGTRPVGAGSAAGKSVAGGGAGSPLPGAVAGANCNFRVFSHAQRRSRWAANAHLRQPSA